MAVLYDTQTAFFEKLINEYIGQYKSNALFAISDHINFYLLNSTNPFLALIYMNKCSKIGKFAMVFQYQLLEYTNNNDLENLRLLFENPFTPEYDDNPLLNSVETEAINKQILLEKMALNNYFDNQQNNVPYGSCLNDVCLFINPNNEMVENLEDYNVWVAQKGDNTISSYCFKLPNLLNIVYTNGINPYTGTHFQPQTIATLHERYSTQLKFIEIYNNFLRSKDLPSDV